MPKPGSFVEFHTGQNQFKVPFMMYTDFEAILRPVHGRDPDPNKPYTKKVNRHIPSGFCIYSKFAYGEVSTPLKLYRGEDCIHVFCNYVKKEARRLYHMFPEKPMEPLTSEEWTGYNRATKCHICFKPFEELNPKVRDHCHYTGKYRGPAHRNCNLRYKIPSYIPVIFHNLSGYDAHLFIQELGKETNKTGTITDNKEKYISFTTDAIVDEYQDEGKTKEKKIQLRFIYSFRFMASSLDSLTNNLVKFGQKLTRFEDYSEDQYALLIRKRVYPYEYMTSWDKLTETQLPPKKAFHSTLNMSDIDERDYEHSQRAWRAFNLKNLGEYHDLYLKTNVILMCLSIQGHLLRILPTRSGSFLYVTWTGLASMSEKDGHKVRVSNQS